MMQGRRFLLDTNTFIQAKNLHYGFDICPGFWKAIDRLHTVGSLCSIDRVRGELSDFGDELAAWAKDSARKSFFKGTADQAVIEQFGSMVTWVGDNNQYSEQAKAGFASGADGWIIAFAKSNEMTVVTHEVFKPDIKRRVPIPNVCRQFGIDCITPFEMLRELKVQFVLRKKIRRTT